MAYLHPTTGCNVSTYISPPVQIHKNIKMYMSILVYAEENWMIWFTKLPKLGANVHSQVKNGG